MCVGVTPCQAFVTPNFFAFASKDSRLIVEGVRIVAQVGIGVDTHVHRITNRLRWHKKETQTAEQTRFVPFYSIKLSITSR